MQGNIQISFASHNHLCLHCSFRHMILSVRYDTGSNNKAETSTAKKHSQSAMLKSCSIFINNDAIHILTDTYLNRTYGTSLQCSGTTQSLPNQRNGQQKSHFVRSLRQISGAKNLISQNDKGQIQRAQ